MQLIGIVAVSRNGVIGRDDTMPLWYLPSDLRYFKMETLGHPVIMGRKTYDAIGHPLSDRLNIVVSHTLKIKEDGVVVAKSIKKALLIAKRNDTTLFVIGGGDIFRQLMPQIDRLFITEVDCELAGDVVFTYDPSAWEETEKKDFMADKENEYSFTRRKLERR